MKNKSKARRATAAGLAIASGGLTACPWIVGDPAPPPALECDEVSEGESLGVTATRSGDLVTAIVTHRPSGPAAGEVAWASAEVSNLTGATLENTYHNPESVELIIRLELDSPTIETVSFVLTGVLTDGNHESCPVSRTFELTIHDGSVTISQRDSYPRPFLTMEPAQIAVVGQNGWTLELEAISSFKGPTDIEWSASAGSVKFVSANRASWTPPRHPGMYQIEATLDYGEYGLAMDALVVEVAEPEPDAS